MAPAALVEGQHATTAVDPVTRHILHRTMTQQRVSSSQQDKHDQEQANTFEGDPHTRKTVDAESPRRSETGTISKAARDRRKAGSFLSRFIGSKKRDETQDGQDGQDDDASSMMWDMRSGGNDAEVFSQPIGFVPKFPAPPRYIRVKAQNRTKRDLNRLFLAQILQEPRGSRSRKPSIDAKIHGIGESVTNTTLPNSSRKTVENAIWATEFSKDGKYLATGGQDKKVRIWEIVSSKDDREKDPEREDGAGSGEQSTKLKAPVFQQRLLREFDGHSAAILDVSWSKNNFLLSSSMDKTVRLYHVSRAECLCAFKHNDYVTSVAFHPRDDRFYLAGSLDSKVRLWSIPDKNVAFWAQAPDMVTAVSFTPDGKTAIAGTLSGICILYHTEGLKAHSQIHVRSTRGKNNKRTKITGIDTFAPSQEGDHTDVKLLITSNDSRIRMYNLKDRSLEMKFKGNDNTCSQIKASFSDDGRFVICGSEDRKVYVWPTGPLEKADTDKRPVEIFEASSQIVTTAIFAPTETKTLLARSADPIYDICNPPPVVLLGRTDSGASSLAPTHVDTTTEARPEGSDTLNEKNSARRLSPVESPSYVSRHVHSGGHIIVTGDYTGQVKVFREDCAYQKRRDINWDVGSTFSRKMLGRSNSTTPRTTSAASSYHRHSQPAMGIKSPSKERILSWRSSISASHSTATSVSDLSTRRSYTDADRHSSPQKLFSSRFSLRNSHTAQQASANGSVNGLAHAATSPNLTLQSDSTLSSSDGHYGGSFNHFRQQTHLSPVGEKSPASDVPLSSGSMDTNKTGRDQSQQHPVDDNPLKLIGDHSYMAWDVENTLAPMANAPPRTPGNPVGARTPGGGDYNPLSRNTSVISRLSSELSAPGSKVSSEISENGTSPRIRINSNQKTLDGVSSAETDEELKCQQCNGERFRMIKLEDGGRGLRCRDCSKLV